MSTIERERRVEFNDGMDELPSLDNDVEDLCGMLQGGDPRTAAIMRRRYERKGLMKTFPEKTMTPPEALGLPSVKPQPAPQPAKQLPQPVPQPKPQMQPTLPTKVPERPSMERKSFERKSWADMSTESEDENVVESFASTDSVEGAPQLAWDPIGAEVSPVAGRTPTSEKGTFWLKVWQNMTGRTVEEHLSQESVPPAPMASQGVSPQHLPTGPMAPLTPPEALSPTSDQGGQGMTTGYMPCQMMNAQPLPVMPVQTVQAVQAVQAVPVQPMMMFFTPKPLGPPSTPGTSFNFIPCSEAQSFHSVHSVQSEPEMPPLSPLPSAPCFHMKTAQLGQLSADRRSFTKTKSKGRLSIASTDRLYNCGVARYCVQFVSGELSNADGVGIVFSSQLPCPQNIQRIISIFANRTGRICMRADADVERSHVNIKAIELGDWLEVLCDFDARKVTFSVWPADGQSNVSSATVDFSGASDRFRRLSAQVPTYASGYLAVVLKHPGLTVTLGDA